MEELTGEPPAGMPMSLRERKKVRTRQALVSAALDLFTERGFGAVTLDVLCDTAEVSKRTFFRTFDSKEDVALTPLRDLWGVFMTELESAEPSDQSVFELIEGVLITSIGGMGAEGWADQLRMSRTLTAQTPSMEAHGLAFCERTNADIVDVLRRRFDLSNDPYDLRPRLAVDLLAAAFHRALDRWVADAERPGPDSLANSLREACAAAPGSLTLLARPR